MKKLSQNRKNTNKIYENYIYELFMILQYKTENEFRKSQLFEPIRRVFGFFLINDCFILVKF